MGMTSSNELNQMPMKSKAAVRQGRSQDIMTLSIELTAAVQRLAITMRAFQIPVELSCLSRPQ